MLLLAALWIGMSAQAQVSTFINCFVSDSTGNQVPCVKAADATGKVDLPRGQMTNQQLVERVDVPAIHIGYYDPPNCHKTKCIHAKTTCADKTRVLWHDESNPPRFWCHRVQSQ